MNTTLYETVQKILDGRVTETYSNGFFGINKGTRIKLKNSFEKRHFSTLYHRACEILGEPTFVYSYYGFVWESEGGFIAYTSITEYDDGFSYDFSINFFVFDKQPLGNKLSYRDYSKTVETAKRIFAEHGFYFERKDRDLTLVGQYYNNKQFSFLAQSENAQCLLTIKRNYMFFGYSRMEVMDEKTTIFRPLCARKKKMRFTDAAVIERELKSCFDEASKKLQST